jgi:nitrogen PTS system EIIA component
MSHETFSLDELAIHLGRDRREIEKLVQRGRIPGRKVGNDWQFVQAEITHWLEQEMREYTSPQLAQPESQHNSLELDPLHPVSSVLSLDTIQIPLEGRTKRSVLESLVEIAGRTWHIWEPAAVLKAIRDREEVMSTAFDNGVAIPHPRNPLPEAVGQPIIAYARAFKPIPFGGPRGGMTDLFFLVISRDASTHLRLLARLGQMIREPEFLERLRSTDDPVETFEIIREYDDAIQQRD